VTTNRPRGPIFALSLSISLLLFCGCAGTWSTPQKNPSWRSGYALLYDLLSQNAHLDKILWIKFESDDVDDIVAEIVALCAEGKLELEKFAEADDMVHLEAQPLPIIELETRSAIESETADELLGTSGIPFEVKLLNTQLSALRYAANLCRVLANHERDSTRNEFLADFDKRCVAMREKVFATIASKLPKKE
jgi:hypothetical protein